MNQAIDILRSFHQRSIPCTVQGSTIVVGAKIDVLLEQNKKLSDEEKDRIKELNDRLDNPAKYAQYLIRYFQEKDIVELLNDFEKKFKRFDQKDINKYGIKKLRDTLTLAPKTKTEVKREGAEKVFENDEAVVLKVTTKEASCYYGAGTKWCISARDENLFDMHHKDHNIYFVLNKQLSEDDPLYKVAVLVGGNNKKIYYDSLDDTIKPSEIKPFNIPISVFKKPSAQELINRFKASLETNEKGEYIDDSIVIKKYLVKNGKLLISFTGDTILNDFHCGSLKLKNLNNTPKIIKGWLNIVNNELTNFKNGPTEALIIDCSNNKFNNFKGFPKNTISIDAAANQITSLEGLPKKLDSLDIRANPGEFTEEEVRAVCDVGWLKV